MASSTTAKSAGNGTVGLVVPELFGLFDPSQVRDFDCVIYARRNLLMNFARFFLRR